MNLGITRVSNRSVVCRSPDEATCTCWMEPEECLFEDAAGVSEEDVTGSDEGWRGRGSTSFTGFWGDTHAQDSSERCLKEELNICPKNSVL